MPTQKLSELAARLGGEIIGADADIRGVASLDNAGEGELAFFAEGAGAARLENCRASAVIVAPECAERVQGSAWVTDNPRLVFARASALLHPDERLAPGISPQASIDAAATIGKNCAISPFARVGKNAVIGDDCQIHAHAVIADDCVIGARTVIYPGAVLYARTQTGQNCIVHAGAVLGADGFGFVPGEAGMEKIPQRGGVRIGDNVEIGANTTIDRGTVDDTVIHDGVKIDNQVQIGHNVRIGAHTVICGCAGIAGSTVIGKHCLIGGACAIGGHLKIADDVQIAGGSSLNRDAKGGARLSSQWIALPVRQWQRFMVQTKNALTGRGSPPRDD